MAVMVQKKSNVVDFGRRTKSSATQRELALEQLFRDHGAPLRSFLFGRLRDEAEIEDVMQEVFARLARKEGLEQRLAATHAKNRAYIFTAANNLIVDMERRRAVRRDYCARHSEQAGETVYELSPEVQVVAVEELSRVKEAIKNLKPTWRKAFVMSRLKCLSYREISREMGVSTKQIEKYVANAIVKLREAAQRDNRKHRKEQTQGQGDER